MKASEGMSRRRKAFRACSELLSGRTYELKKLLECLCVDSHERRQYSLSVLHRVSLLVHLRYVHLPADRQSGTKLPIQV